jgi:acyl-CoA synthetase (AMP-forming)/AMP-acid ligase II
MKVDMNAKELHLYSEISFQLTERDIVCIPVPLYHCFGLVMGNLGSITHGSTIVYPSAAFDAEETLKVRLNAFVINMKGDFEYRRFKKSVVLRYTEFQRCL